MLDLSPSQIAILERLRNLRFEIVAFPMYANYVGIRKGNCAALLAPSPSGGFKIFGAPSYLVAGNLAVIVRREGKQWFTWKK